MGYSPPKGRSPTCYSPVRHSHESPKGLTPVRLACLIRAASVRSEPGSNSPLYCVASHSEEQEAHFSYSVLQQFVHPLQTHTLSILTSSLIFPSLLLQKHTPPPASSLQRRYAFQLFKDPILSAPQTSPLGLRRKCEFTPLKHPMSSTNAKINLSFYGILKKPLSRRIKRCSLPRHTNWYNTTKT